MCNLSGEGQSQATNVYEAFVEIIKDLESQATQSGSKDPEVSSILQNMFLGDVDTELCPAIYRHMECGSCGNS